LKINTKNMVSITEANQNFSRVAKMVDENGMAIIFKNNVPRYVITEFSEYEEEKIAEDEEVIRIAGRLIDKHRRAFEELAK